MTFSVTSGGDVAGDTVTITGTSDSAALQFKQQVTTGGSVPDGLADQTFTFLVNDRFLGITGTGSTKINTAANSRISAYSVTRSSSESGTNASIVNVSVTRKTLSQTVYTQFGDFSDKTQISSVLSVIGDQSGLRKDIKIILQQQT
jgi:hypothetical protein